eukprot:gene13667-19555_t
MSRSSFLEKLKHGEAVVRNPRDAGKLFTKLLKREPPESLALTCDEALLPALTTALGITANSLGPPLELLAALGAEQLSHGVYASRVLRIFHTFWEALGFMQSIQEALIGNKLRDPAVVARMLIKLAPEVEAVRQCKDPYTAKVVELLHCSTAEGMSALAPRLATLFIIVAMPSGATLPPSQAAKVDAFPESLQAAKSAMRPPGVRDHDNDSADYRSISILPTPAELNCQELPYLPPVEGSDFITDREASMLDRCFRLMREDLLGSLREELAEEMTAGASCFRRLYRNPQVSKICTEPLPYVLLSVPVPSRLAARVSKMKAEEASNFFHSGPGRRVLANEALVLLMDHASSSNSSATPPGGIHAQGAEKKRLQLHALAVGLVVMRRGKGWDMVDKLKSGKLQVGISFPGETSMAVITQRLIGMQDTKPIPCPFLFSASAGYYTYEPVLWSLQRMSGVPLRETLAHMEPPGMPELLHSGRAVSEFSEEIQGAVQSDSTQSAALQLALASKVVLIQGPPGTGKTYIGVHMVKAILEAHSRWGGASGQSAVPKILCLSFANHALDSFLESLMDAGVPESKFIRMGSSPKISARLKPRCLRENPDARFSKAETHAMQFSREVGAKNKPIKPNYLWKRWCAGKGRGAFKEGWVKAGGKETPYIWAMSKEDRCALKKQWNSEWLQPQRKQLAEVMQKMSKNARSLDDLRLSSNSRVLLSTATIIGCTTAGADRMRGILQEFAPDIVLVEEAGEIFEAQVLSTIGDKCKQLIMIGDHQQLRPKAECYNLRREAGSGFDMDVSLFERLVKHVGGEGSLPLPFVTLHVQHRMRPEVSHLIRHTMYPQLVDHTCTLHHPRVPGIARPVLFINHNHPEAAGADTVALGDKSKVNMHEVQMVCCTAKYLLQQAGCSPTTSITILTPYLGQLAEICKALVELRIRAELNDMDVRELQSFDLMDTPAVGEGRRGTVRAATVDTFQGEESDIVLISLVRSNAQGDIGFLSSAERVNVLLSRARNGMYLFGNMHCLTNCRAAPGRNLWGRLAGLLRDKGQLLDFLPAVCKRHKSVTELKEPADFDLAVKHGGCMLPCGDGLPCGHPCPLPCHPNAVVGDVEGELLRVLEMYNAKGVMAADNLLDTLILDSPAEATQRGLQAARFIFTQGLDPSGVSSWVGEGTDPPTPSAGHPTNMWVDGKGGANTSGIDAAVCNWAAFLHLQQQYPQLAMQHAERVQRFSEVHPLGRCLPSSWVEVAKAALSAPQVNGKPQPMMEIRDESEAARARWEEVKAKDLEAAPEVMAEVMGMVGLAEVKDTMISQYLRIKLAKRQGTAASSSYNARFDGNPGTGKTTVARHYSTFLAQLEVVPEEALFVELSGAELVNRGVTYLKDKLAEVKEAGGGVLFINEANQLVSDHAGKQVLDFILPLAEGLASTYGPLVWLFAGYSKDTDSLFEHNVGLPSRFPLRFAFKDYSDKELELIFRGLMEKEPAGSGGSKQPKKKKKKKKDPAPLNPAMNMYYGQQETVVKDHFGNEWTWKGASWYDKYRNTSGYGPKSNAFASTRNPVVSPNGVRWHHDGQQWKSDQGGVQAHYPGSQAPPAKEQRRANPFTCSSDKAIRIAIRRLGQRRGQPGFGNARAVRAMFDTVRGRQADRIIEEEKRGSSGRRKPNIFEFVQTDLLGPPPTPQRLRGTVAYAELKKLEGLQPVKDQVEQLIEMVARNWERELREEPLLDVVLNRIFLGNPGTGKTTVAALYGSLLGEMGLLSKGEVLLKNPSDFLGDVIGSSEKQTRAILKAAEGCVLVIDEAYSLCSANAGASGANDPYKTAVVDTLVEQVEARAGDDRAVVLLGYEAEMRNMMKHTNPGLARRFQLEHAFVFPDFCDAALIRILMVKARTSGLKLNLGVAKQAVASLAGARAKPNFGNAGTLDNLLSQAKLALMSRPAGSDQQPLTLADFGIAPERVDNTALDSLFDNLLGCEGVIEHLGLLRSTVTFCQERGEELAGVVSYNYVFTSSPGTGKTTVARRMGRMFKALGLLPDAEVQEVSASDLISGYTGQAGKVTREALQRSRGGVLFIDEAYQLDPARGGSYMTEVVDELVKALTSEEFKDKVLVILAGYREDMDRMMSTNPGLSSRFAEQLHFEDLSVEATAAMMLAKMSRLQLSLAQCARDGATSLAKELVCAPQFGNGRDVETWCLKTRQAVAIRAKHRPREAEVTVEDMRTALDRMLQGKRILNPEERPVVYVLGPLLQQQAAPAAPRQVREEMEQEVEKELEEEEEEEGTLDKTLQSVEGPFDGVAHRVLRQLQSVLDAEGLNSKEGVAKMAGMDPEGADFAWLQAVLVGDLGMSPEGAREQLLKWQAAQK